MREIKFRAWDKSEECFVIILAIEYTYSGEIFRLKVQYENGAQRFLVQGEYELVEFIGLKDKNRKEVYENDYLFDGKIIHLVKHYATEYSSVFDLNGLQNITKYCEIVGNSLEDNYDELVVKYLETELPEEN